jgi:hypothetical protein
VTAFNCDQWQVRFPGEQETSESRESKRRYPVSEESVAGECNPISLDEVKKNKQQTVFKMAG